MEGKKMIKSLRRYNQFNTHEMLVLIEDVSYTKSAFGVNESGDIVFFNSRLVSKMDIDIGDEINAHCIPNYEDKREIVKWRCISV